MCVSEVRGPCISVCVCMCVSGVKGMYIWVCVRGEGTMYLSECVVCHSGVKGLYLVVCVCVTQG